MKTPLNRPIEINRHHTFVDGFVCTEPALNNPDIFTDRPQILDVLAGIIALIVFTLPFLIILVLIRLDSPGPAIFRQVRLGKGLKPFEFYKFRTMYRDAAQRFPELYNYSAAVGTNGDFMFKVPDDPRVTRVGRFLRRTSLDELPNFINVIKGDCALVGPRPDIPEMLPHYTAHQRIRFTVPQGLFGLAQIKGANRLTFAQTADLDAEYVAQRSFWLDIKIAARVALTVFRGDLH